jgi:hypothetical protein
MKISGRYNIESYKMRGGRGIPSDIVKGWTRSINGKEYDFSHVAWAYGGYTLTVRKGGLTTVVHEWNWA